MFCVKEPITRETTCASHQQRRCCWIGEIDIAGGDAPIKEAHDTVIKKKRISWDKPLSKKGKKIKIVTTSFTVMQISHHCSVEGNPIQKQQSKWV